MHTNILQFDCVARLKGTVGMYDSLSGKFFANAASSGQFIAVLS